MRSPSCFPSRAAVAAALCITLTDRSPAMAREADPVTAAVAVVREAFDALERRDWESAARLIDPQVLAEFKRLQVEHYRLQRRMEEQGQPVPAYRDTTMPPAVAEWFEQQAAKHREPIEVSLSERFDVGSIEELEALTPQQMAARWLASNDPEVALRRDLERELRAQDSAVAARIDPERVSLPRWRYRVLGGVREAETEVYVLYRVVHEHEGAAPSSGGIGVVPATAAAEGWRLRADPLHLSFAGPNTMSVLGIHVAWDESLGNDYDAWLREMAETVVTWPEAGPEAGRAFLRGLTPENRQPEALVLEARRNGETVRMEIPREAFQALANLLTPWEILRP